VPSDPFSQKRGSGAAEVAKGACFEDVLDEAVAPESLASYPRIREVTGLSPCLPKPRNVSIFLAFG